MTTRTPEELIHTDEPAWPDIEQLVAEHPTAQVLPVDPERGRRTLWRIQVTARSWLGGLALHTGGILADHGWFRLYGGGSEFLPDLAAINHQPDPDQDPVKVPMMVVGHDVLGGVFAIHGGDDDIEPGEIAYFALDTMAWEGLGLGHAAYVDAAVTGRLADAFDELRWPGWEAEVAALRPDQGLSLYPPPFTAEGKDLSQVSRRPVPIAELLELYAGVTAASD